MDEKGNELVAQNADKPFVPASVAKIVTAWWSLGGDYRFQTKFYLDKNRVLYVRGGGDPFLISEELAQLASQLVAATGKEPITGIVLDASSAPPTSVPGIEVSNEAYDALLRARGELQYHRPCARARRSAPPSSRPRSRRWRSASSGRGAPTVAAASAWPRTPR